jgi:hypothetical protein
MNKAVCACNVIQQLPLVVLQLVHAMQCFEMRTKMGWRRPGAPPAQI